ISGGGAVRAGVFGSLSTISSPRASRVNKITVVRCPTNANRVPARCNQPRWAPQQTAAGAVSERNPATQPRRKQRSNSMARNPLSREIAVAYRFPDSPVLGRVQEFCHHKYSVTSSGLARFIQWLVFFTVCNR